MKEVDYETLRKNEIWLKDETLQRLYTRIVDMNKENEKYGFKFMLKTNDEICIINSSEEIISGFYITILRQQEAYTDLNIFFNQIRKFFYQQYSKEHKILFDKIQAFQNEYNYSVLNYKIFESLKENANKILMM